MLSNPKQYLDGLVVNEIAFSRIPYVQLGHCFASDLRQ